MRALSPFILLEFMGAAFTVTEVDVSFLLYTRREKKRLQPHNGAGPAETGVSADDDDDNEDGEAGNNRQQQRGGGGGSSAGGGRRNKRHKR